MASSKPNESSRKNSKSQNNPSYSMVAEAKIKPHERRSLLLGSFTLDNVPVGFSFEARPSNVLESIVANISISDAAAGRKYVSFVTNNADKPVNIKVYQLQ